MVVVVVDDVVDDVVVSTGALIAHATTVRNQIHANIVFILFCKYQTY